MPTGGEEYFKHASLEESLFLYTDPTPLVGENSVGSFALTQTTFPADPWNNNPVAEETRLPALPSATLMCPFPLFLLFFFCVCVCMVLVFFRNRGSIKPSGTVGSGAAYQRWARRLFFLEIRFICGFYLRLSPNADLSRRKRFFLSVRLSRPCRLYFSILFYFSLYLFYFISPPSRKKIKIIYYSIYVRAGNKWKGSYAESEKRVAQQNRNTVNKVCSTL